MKSPRLQVSTKALKDSENGEKKYLNITSASEIKASGNILQCQVGIKVESRSGEVKIRKRMKEEDENYQMESSFDLGAAAIAEKKGEKEGDPINRSSDGTSTVIQPRSSSSFPSSLSFQSALTSPAASLAAGQSQMQTLTLTDSHGTSTAQTTVAPYQSLPPPLLQNFTHPYPKGTKIMKSKTSVTPKSGNNDPPWVAELKNKMLSNEVCYTILHRAVKCCDMSCSTPPEPNRTNRQ